MTELFPPSLDDQVACVRREITMRERVYPRRIAAGHMGQALADRETLLMRAVLDTLLALQDKMKRRPLPAGASEENCDGKASQALAADCRDSDPQNQDRPLGEDGQPVSGRVGLPPEWRA